VCGAVLRVWVNWRYIGCADGSEGLHDMIANPNKPANLAPGSSNRILTYDKEFDTATWEGREIRRGDPVPQ